MKRQFQTILHSPVVWALCSMAAIGAAAILTRSGA